MSFQFSFNFEGRMYHADAFELFTQNTVEYHISLSHVDLQRRFGNQLNFWRSLEQREHYGYEIPDAPDGLRFAKAVIKGLVEHTLRCNTISNSNGEFVVEATKIK